MEFSPMEATDWLDEVVQQTKGKYQAQRALEEELIQEEALKRKLGTQYCRELFTWLETIEVKFNHRFGAQVLTASVVGSEGDRSVQVLARPIRADERIAELRYEEDINCLALSMGSGATAATQIIKMVRPADGGILAEIDAERYTPEQLGQKIINDLLGIGPMRLVSQPRSPEPPGFHVPCDDIGMCDRTVVAGGNNGGCAGAVA
jgi:hypothetical protein